MFEIEVRNGYLYNGDTSINIDALGDITKEEFIEQHKGKFTADINVIWNNIKAHREVMAIHNKQVKEYESTRKPSQQGKGTVRRGHDPGAEHA